MANPCGGSRIPGRGSAAESSPSRRARRSPTWRPRILRTIRARGASARSVEPIVCSRAGGRWTCTRRRWGSGGARRARLRGCLCRSLRTPDRLARPPWPADLSVAVGRTNTGPTPMSRPLPSPGHGMTARSNNPMSPNSVRVARPLPSGTVTRETLGRMSWTNGNRENLGRRGTISRAVTWLVCARVP